MSRLLAFSLLGLFLTQIAVVYPSRADQPRESKPKTTRSNPVADPGGQLSSSDQESETSGMSGSYDGSDEQNLLRVQTWLHTSQLWKALSNPQKEAAIQHTLQAVAIGTVAGTSLYMIAARSLSLRAAAIGLPVIGAYLAMTGSANADETLEYQTSTDGVERFYSSYGSAKEALALESSRADLLRFHQELARQLSQ